MSNNFHRIESMPHLVSDEKCFVLDSGGKNVQNKTSDGSRFVITLNSALEIPRNAINLKCDVHRVLVWNTFYNITAKLNNNSFVLTSYLANGTQSTQTITIPDGSYTPNLLEIEIQSIMSNLGYIQTPAPPINISADQARGRIILQFNYTDTTVNFTNGDFADIIGFDKTQYGNVVSPLPAPTQATQKIVAPKNANFNKYEYLLLKSNLASGEGIMVNNVYDNYIAMIPISVAPFSQIQDLLSQPIELDSSLLKGNFGAKNVWLELCDQNGDPVDTNGENFSVMIKIKYQYRKFDV
jgi:hypothetical protein